MDNAKLIKLLTELEVVIDTQRKFVQPRSAIHPSEWSQQEMEQFAFLRKQRDDIVAEITRLEASAD